MILTVPTSLRAIPAILGQSALLQAAVIRADRFAASRVPVLIAGETGTGKELLAQYVHARSGRRGEMVDLNCGALPRDMVEGLLFGHRRGAFTGAVEDQAGLVARADGGTLFLDEIASLPLESQAKLLRLLETGELRRLGETSKRRVDFRLVAAVQDDFGDRVRSGQFRRDLYYRIEGVRLELPPLRSRPEDIGVLAAYFAAERGCDLGPGAVACLRGYSWPGNVRELRTVIERAVVLASESTLGVPFIEEALGQSTDRNGDGSAGTTCRAQLIELCARHGGEAPRIAAALDISRATLYRRLKENRISLRVISKSHEISRALEVL